MNKFVNILVLLYLIFCALLLTVGIPLLILYADKLP